MATVPNTISCPRCGNQVAAAGKFCNKCGAALPAGVTAPVATAPVRPAGRPTGSVLERLKGLSIWWLIIPTAFFIFLSRQVIPIAIVVAAGAGLWWWKSQPLAATTSPTRRQLQPFAYALQFGVVFVMLGGVIAAIALAIMLVVVYYVVRNGRRLVVMLEPWWKLQSSIPPKARKALAFVVPFCTGWYFGTHAGGFEWGFTLLSVSLGAAIGFLFLFTPPASLRGTGT